MSLMQSPVAILLLHRTETEEAQARRQHPRLPAPTRSVRVRIGQILIAAGTRLDPIAQSERPEPAMGQLSIAR